jgi:hypothetical protein
MDSTQYIEAKRLTRLAWERSVAGYSKLPADYQQLLLDHFNRVWEAGLRNEGVFSPTGIMLGYIGPTGVRFHGKQVQPEYLCQLDQDVYNVARSVAKQAAQ